MMLSYHGQSFDCCVTDARAELGQCESRTQLQTVRQQLSSDDEGLKDMLLQVGMQLQTRKIVGVIAHDNNRARAASLG